MVPWNREKLSQTLYECLDTVGTDIIFTKVEGQGFEGGGCSQSGEMLGVVIIDVVLCEAKGQGAERGGLYQTSSEYTVKTSVSVTKVEGQGAELGGCSQSGEVLCALGTDEFSRKSEVQGVERGGFSQSGEIFGAFITDVKAVVLKYEAHISPMPQ